MLRDLYDHYLSKVDGLDSLVDDYETIIRRVEALSNSEEKKQFLTGLIELAARCLEKKIGELSRKQPEGEAPKREGLLNKGFGWIQDRLKEIKESIPAKSFQDGIQSWKAIRSMNRYEFIREAFLSRAITQNGQERLEALRGRADQLQISLRFPWEEGEVSNAVESQLRSLNWSCLEKETKPLNQLQARELRQQVNDRVNRLREIIREGNVVTSTIDRHRTTCARQMVVMVARTVSALAVTVFLFKNCISLSIFRMLFSVVGFNYAFNYVAESYGSGFQLVGLLFAFYCPIIAFQLLKQKVAVLVTLLVVLLISLMSIAFLYLSEFFSNNNMTINWRHQGFPKSWFGQKVGLLADGIAPVVQWVLDVNRPKRVRV